jgi:hypothetical protein
LLWKSLSIGIASEGELAAMTSGHDSIRNPMA